ncbi:MAG TPA: 2,3-bisphosphoglycerate-independent phosphoglycerate mutase [Dissulfurispiraceae bacterium]|nr:2,3-bisphosphoglycerate-independent phosphoglycerate mutase [Dissulfurispiraceae bacterium]
MQQIINSLLQKNSSKIVLVVLDGLGGIPVNGKTELEAADTPNLDALARISACGLHIPVAPGITPGSGPGHLALFGYDPVASPIGRGILEALGLGMEIRKTDIAVRCNYSTIRDGAIQDRRAGRIPTEQSKLITVKLQKAVTKIDGVNVMISAGMEHRFAVRFRFPETLPPDSAMIADTDPQKEGLMPLPPKAAGRNAERVAAVAVKFIEQAAAVLKNEEKANFLLMRGFSTMPDIPMFGEAYGMKALAIATYPMYRGLARLIEMEAPIIEGGVADEISFLKKNYDKYDFFFLHVKKIDSYGEDGNFEGKKERIEEFDALLPDILEFNPDVLIITGDHSTPSAMSGHSWHPVPIILKGPYVYGGFCEKFSERECYRGELGVFPSVQIMPLAMANAMRLKKFGA